MYQPLRKKTTSGLMYLGLALGLAATSALADYNPITLTPGSFNADVVVEKTAAKPLPDYVSVTIDNATNLTGNTFFERGYHDSFSSIGLPVANSTITAYSNASYSFTMPPTYVTNNVIFVGGATPAGGSGPTINVQSGTLTLTTPAVFTNLVVLFTGGGNPSNIVTYVVHHQGGGTETGTFGTPDWFNNTVDVTNVAYIAGGRVDVGNGSVNNINSTTTTKLFYYDGIYLSDVLNPVTSIDFSLTLNIATNRSFIFALCGSADGINYTPIPVTGFNKDVVVEATAPRTGFLTSKVTVVMDSGATNLTGNTWYEKGANPGAPTTGIPPAGSTFTNAALTRVFKMPPTYVGNNCVYLGNYAGYTTGTLTLSSPAAYNGLSFLASCANGPLNVNWTVQHADSSSESSTAVVPITDWFNTATPAYWAAGRFAVDNVGFNDVNSTSRCKLYSFDIAFSNPSPVTRVDFTYVSGGRGGIFALSGQTNSGGIYFPINITGFDADIVVEASAFSANPSKAPFPSPLTTATDVSMDGGTNNTGNTWYEQGYYAGMPGSGLPPAGSTIQSLSLSDHYYQMPASYTANNCVFVDYAHTNWNVTPANPAWYSALSFLSATANGRVTNQCIIQYSDGTADTNVFISQDWFGNNPYAFVSNGRLDLGRRTINNDPGRNAVPNNPRFYEAQFALRGASDLTTQNYTVTNVILQFLGAQNATSGRMVAMAVSGTTGPVAPVIRLQPGNITTVEGSNIVMSVVMGGGTPPFTYEWQVGTNNIWVTVADGGLISGATTPDLTFTSIGWTNTADYRFIARGAAGSTTSIVARITVLSGLLDMASVGDPITAFGGTSGGTEGPEHTIDHVIQKCLINSGQSPYVGPAGWVLTPSLGSTILNVLRFYTANDSEGRDPASYLLEGSNDGGTTWSTISSGALALPAGRNGTGNVALNPLTMNIQEIRFANSADYKVYRLSIPTLKNASNGNPALMQIGEVEFLGVQKPVAPTITVEPVSSLTVFVGATPTLSVKAIGYPTNLTYQWYQGATPVGANSSSYTLPAVQLTDSGKTFSCTVANVVGSTNSTTATLSVIAAPTQSYPVAVMADNPLAFWRLDEVPDDGMGNTGKTAKDYAGGNNGQYSYTTLGAQGYNPLIDSDTAVSFGGFVDINGAVVDNYVGSIPGLDFYSPTNTSRNFSAEAWVLGSVAQQVGGAAIIAAGYGGGGEQFAVDCGGGNNALRFYFRDIAGNAHNVSGTNVVSNDGKWHHVVAVLDEANTNQAIYVDGLLSARATFGPGLGVRTQTTPLSIGSRKQNATTNYNLGFQGTIDEVAVYGYALSSNQVLSHYYASQPAPQFIIQPTNATVAENASVTFYSQAYGPGTLSYQWFQSTDFGTTWTPMTGQTSPNLTLASVPATYNSYMYQVGAANAYGSNVSAVATLSVAAGAPYMIVDLPQSLLVYAGRTNLLAVTAGGTAPFTYSWTKDGSPLSDGNGISGSQSNILTIANAQTSQSGTYQVTVANGQGSALSMPCAVLVQSRPSFNTNGFGWALNGNSSVATIDADTLTLTIGAGSTARSAWYTAPLYIGAFQAFFRYQDVGTGGADGATFCLQNDPRGVTALGGAGGSLGVSGITPSAELEFNIYNGNPLGIAYHVNGATGGYTSSQPVDPSAGDPIGVVVRYVGGTMFITMTNQGGASFSTSIAADLPAVLGGSTAYVGFTGADGGVVSTQVIKDFQFVPLPVLTAQVASPTTVLLTWPGTIGGYTLQSKSTLTGGTWQTVPVTTYGQALVTSTGQQFYRLVLP